MNSSGPLEGAAGPITKQLVLVKPEARQVRTMFGMAADGKTPREIAEIILDAFGQPRPQEST